MSKTPRIVKPTVNAEVIRVLEEALQVAREHGAVALAVGLLLPAEDSWTGTAGDNKRLSLRGLVCDLHDSLTARLEE